MKHCISMWLALICCAATFAQSLRTFDAPEQAFAIKGWHANSHFLLQETGSELDVIMDKGSFEAMSLELGANEAAQDLQLSFTAKTSQRMNLRLDLLINGESISQTQQLDAEPNGQELSFRFQLPSSKTASAPTLLFYPAPGESFAGMLTLSQLRIKANLRNLKPEVTVFPNPGKHRVTIDLNDWEAKQLQLISTTGQVMMQKGITSPAGENIDLDVSHLTPGIYFLQLNGQNQSQSTKLIIFP
ncbi:MAG: T9SS type A sorting domain-containing protein [Bacteroidota bacterium]